MATNNYYNAVTNDVGQTEKAYQFNAVVGNNDGNLNFTQINKKTGNIAGGALTSKEATIYGSKTLSSTNYSDSTVTATDDNSLRTHADKKNILNQLGIENRVILNVENGATLNNARTINVNSSAGASFKGGIHGDVSVSRTNGDLLDNSKISAGVGFRNKLPSLNFEWSINNGQRTTESTGWTFGAGLGVTSLLTLDYRRVTPEGRVETIPIGDLISMAVNPLTAINGITKMFSKPKIDVPRYETVMPDNQVARFPHNPFFEKDSTKPTKDYPALLKSIIDNHQKNPDTVIELGFLEDETGRIKRLFKKESTRQELSDERKQKMAKDLINAGVPADKISFTYSKVEKDDNRLVLQDNYTNVRFVSDKNMQTISGQIFDINRTSPAGENKMKLLSENPEVKNKTNKMNSVEKEMYLNALFYKTQMPDSKQTITEAIKEIDDVVYKQNKTLTGTLLNKENSVVLNELKQNEQMLRFKQEQHLSDKEFELLADYVLYKNDNNKQSLQDSLVEYHQKYVSRGLSMENEETYLKQMRQSLANNPVFKDVMKQYGKEEAEMLTQLAYLYYINHTNEKDINKFTEDFMNGANETYYSNKTTISEHRYYHNNEKNEYYKKLANDTKNEIKHSEMMKQLENDPSFKEVTKGKEKEELKAVRDYAIELKTKIPDLKNKNIDEIIVAIHEETYAKGITVQELKYNIAQRDNQVNVATAVQQTQSVQAVETNKEQIQTQQQENRLQTIMKEGKERMLQIAQGVYDGKHERQEQMQQSNSNLGYAM